MLSAAPRALDSELTIPAMANQVIRRYIHLRIELNMKRLFLIVISFACISFFAEQIRACSCLEYGTPVCAAYWRADAVFVGQLRDTPVEKKSDAEIPTVMLHFIVEQPFRGIAGTQVDVATYSGTSCDMKFDRGREISHLRVAGRRQQ